MDGIILVSACLIGIDCNYKGKDNLKDWVSNLRYEFSMVPVCPEQLGGLSTPRLPAEIINGDGMSIWKESEGEVINIESQVVTNQFLKGAYQMLKITRMLGIKYAVFKDKSPSCGVFNIFDGSFSNHLKEGMGVSAAALHSDGIKLITEKQEDNFHRLFFY